MNSIDYYLNRYDITNVFSTELQNHMHLKTIEKGDCLTHLQEPLNSFYLLVDGKLKIYAMQENGKKVLIRFYRPLNLIGDLELFTDFKPNAIVDALEKSILIEVSMNTLKQYIYECPKFLRFVIRQLSHKLFTFSKISTVNLVYPLENRLASYLCSISQLADDRRIDEIQVNNLEEMASLLCTSYRHLTRVLQQFESEGVIDRNRGKIKILNFDKLDQHSVGLFE